MGTYGCLTCWVVRFHEAREGFFDGVDLSVGRRQCGLALATLSGDRVQVCVDVVRADFQSAHPFCHFLKFILPVFD